MALESEEYLQKLVEKSPVAMLVASGEEERVVLVNEKFTELFGYTLEDVPDVEHWWPLAYPDEKYRDEVRSEWLTKIGIALRTRNEIEAMETAITCKDGSSRYVKTHFSPIGTGAKSMVTFFDVTERRREKQDLSDAERRYRQVFESSRDGFVVVGPDGRFIDCNQAFRSMLGYTLEELKQLENFYEITPERWREWEREEIWGKRLLGQGYSEVYEKEFIRKDGTVFPVELTAYAVRNEQGDLEYIWGIARDITEIKEAMQALSESEERYRTLVEMADDAILLTGPDGHIFSANPAACRMLGRTEEEICSIGRAGVVDLSDPRLKSAVAEREKTGAITTELTMIRGNGEKFPALLTSVVFQRESGDPRTSMVIRDMTESKRAEEALRKSEEQYRTLFEDSKDMIMMTNLKGKFLDINAAGLELLGYDSREELLQVVDIAKDLYVNPDDRKRMLADLRRQGFLKDYELEYKNKAGEIITVYATLTPVRDDSGDIIAIRGIIRDMTERLRLEEQLRQSQKMESIGRLAGGVAHDFNNVLTSIQGYIDLAMLDLPEDSPAYEELLESRAACERAASVTRELLIFSRQQRMQLDTIELNPIIEEHARLLQHLIGERYTLNTSPADDLSTISADAANIEQVIMNLVINARDAMPDGGEITISTANRSVDQEYVSSHHGARTGEFVLLAVKDTGIGMDEETVSHLFEPFFTTKGMAKGSGLGLCVIDGIVDQHQGWIDVESTPGGGTTFNVFLPVASSGKEGSARMGELGGLQGKGEKVLLVEDEKTVRNMAETVLSRNGYVVTAAASAEEAAEIFEQRRGEFDLVFSDVILPKENGVALAARLLKEKPDLKVLLASGYSDAGGRASVEASDFPFIQKPYSLKDLLGRIGEILGG